MKLKQINIPDDVMDVLRRSTITGNVLVLPPGRLDRTMYVSVNKIIEAAGGKWNKKHQGHVFESDPKEVLGLAIESGKVLNHKQTYQFFPTPKQVVFKMLILADIQPGHRILEPSAGTGAILNELPGDTCRVAVEIDPKMADKLHVFGTVKCGDFLSMDGELGKFDRIVMNPPFTGGQDIKHIKHARQFLNPGGRLVTICSTSARSLEYVKSIATHVEGIEAGAFKESGTSIRTVMALIEGKS